MLLAETAGDQGREASDGTDSRRCSGSQVVVQAELKLLVPALLEALAAPFDPALYQRALLVWRINRRCDLKQRLVGGYQDGAEEDVLDQKRMRLVDSSLVVARLLEHLQQPEVAVVLLVC